jgi:phosphate transport system substrate-binding protein
MKRVRPAFAGALLAALACGCGGDAGRPLSVVGSTSVQPFAELLAEEFRKVRPGARVDVQGGGSTAGLQAVAEGIAGIGMCSRALNAEEAARFTALVIARDGLAVVVHPSNPVQALARGQVRDLFSGRIANWRDLGGPDRPVHAITREEGSGTREAFEKLVMGQEPFARRALVQESNGAVKELVRGDPSAVGYMSLGLVGGDLKALAIDGARPTAEEVLAGRYQLVRPFLFVVRGEPEAAAREFIDYVLSREGQAILEREGLVRAGR